MVPRAVGPDAAGGRLVLASSSPRRRELLPLLGRPFEVVAPEVEELTEGEPPDVVLANAERKARAGTAAAGEGATVIGCDTEVVLDGEVLGKPGSPQAARATLGSLSGRAHEVLSGVFVLGPERSAGAVESTKVRFRELAGAEIDAYLETGEWRGRAGAYAVQGLGSSLVAAIEGDLSNVIGLPLPLLASLLDGDAGG